MTRGLHISVSLTLLTLLAACGQAKADDQIPPNSAIQASVPEKCQPITDPVARAKCVDQAKEAEKEKEKQK